MDTNSSVLDCVPLYHFDKIELVPFLRTICIWDQFVVSIQFVVSMQGPLTPSHVKKSLVTFILETVGPRPFHFLSSISMLLITLCFTV